MKLNDAKKISFWIHYGILTGAVIGYYHYLKIHAVHSKPIYIIGLLFVLIVVDLLYHRFGGD